MCSCDQLRKLVAQVRPVGRMSLKPWLTYWLFINLTTTLLTINKQQIRSLSRQMP